MEKRRRDFLRTISGVAALPVLAPLLTARARTDLKEVGPALGRATSTEARAQFPLLGDSVDGRPLVYLDSAATTQRPHAVLDALNKFYMHENANPSVSLHALARHSAALY